METLRIEVSLFEPKIGHSEIGHSMRAIYFTGSLVCLCVAVSGCAANGKSQPVADTAAQVRLGRVAENKQTGVSRKSIWDQMPWAIQKNRGRKKKLPSPPNALSKKDNAPIDLSVEEPAVEVVYPTESVRQVAWETQLRQLYDAPVGGESQETLSTSRLPATSAIR